MHDIVNAIGGMLFWLAVALPLIGGAVAIPMLRRAPRNERPDLGSAMSAATAIAVIALLAGTLRIGQLAGMFGGGPDYVLGLAFGIGAGALLFASALSGYAVLARPRIGSLAVAGVLLGPAILIGGPIGAGAGLQALARSLDVQQAISERAARSDGLNLVVSDLQTTLRPDGAIDTVRLVATVSATRTYRVNVSPVDGGPFFWAEPVPNPHGEGLGMIVRHGAVTFAPGTPVRFEFSARADSYQSLEPGAWEFQMQFIDFQGVDYVVGVPVELR